ncbi:hypothetical protein AOLI_G00040250 [Acnodon oligacanthus]
MKRHKVGVAKLRMRASCARLSRRQGRGVGRNTHAPHRDALDVPTFLSLRELLGLFCLFRVAQPPLRGRNRSRRLSVCSLLVVYDSIDSEKRLQSTLSCGACDTGRVVCHGGVGPQHGGA